jgi:hypothetical protein
LHAARSREKIDVSSLQLAASRGGCPAEQCLPIVRDALARDEDATDPRQPLMLWWAIESKCADDREAVLKLFEESPLWDRPLVRDFILERVMRRFACVRDSRGTCSRVRACSNLRLRSNTRANS